MGYKHGTYQTEATSDISLPVVLDYGHFVVGNAPINKIAKKDRKINEVVRVGTYAEAISYFGGTQDLDFSISQTIKIFFELYGVAPLYLVNIVDPELHKKSGSMLNLEVVNGKVTVDNHKIITESLIVKNGADSQPITDAISVWTDEGLVIYATPSNGTTIEIDYDEIDLSLVTKSQAIGGYDTQTMKRTGLELVNDIFLKYSELPAFMDVPDFSDDSEVAAILATKAKYINSGMFESIALINAPIDKRYDELVSWKEDNNILNEDQVILYGKIGLSDKIYFQSLHYAALSLKIDADNDGVPSQGSSNFAYKMDSLVWKNANGELEEIRLDKEQQANFLNKNGVVTAINFKGWRCWGSETAKNPLATDPKDKFIYTRRMFKFIGNELVISYFDRVDRKFTRKLADTITKSMNIRLNSLVASNNFLAASAEFSAEDNNVLNVINGDITWIINLGIIPGVKSMTFKKKYDVNAITEFANNLTS